MATAVAGTPYRLSRPASRGLDCLRLLAAQAVVLGHGISFFDVHPLVGMFVEHPWIQSVAVVVFFVLSGFLIAMATLRKREHDARYGFREYFIERFARIYSGVVPALLFILVLDCVAVVLNPSRYAHAEALNPAHFFGNLLMLQDFPIRQLGITSFGSARPLWTLAVEWWIYLWFGWMVLACQPRRRWLFLLVLILVSIVPYHNLKGGRGHALTLYWLFGVAVYLILRGNQLAAIGSRTVWALTAWAGITAGRAIWKTPDAYDGRNAAWFALFLLFLVEALNRLPDRSEREVAGGSSGLSWATAGITFGANYSFTLYLTHYSIQDFLSQRDGWSTGFAPLAVSLLLSNVLAVALALPTEMQHRRLAAWLKRVGRIATDEGGRQSLAAEADVLPMLPGEAKCA